MPFVLLWCRAFLLTLALEIPLAARLLRPGDPGLGRRIAAVLLANLASHPAVWFVFPELGAAAWPTLVMSELWALGSEILIYRLIFPALSWRRAGATSALANGLSFAVGWWMGRAAGG